MAKQMNKVRDMSNARYIRHIEGDRDMLQRIALMYDEFVYRNKYYPDGFTTDGKLILSVPMSVWNEMVRNLYLVCQKDRPQKRYWRIAC